MDICKTCEHWNNDSNVDDVQTINENTWLNMYEGDTYFNASQIASKFDIAIGKCESPNLLKLKRPYTVTDVCLLDYEQGTASMVTASNFGCVNHKEITELQTKGESIMRNAVETTDLEALEGRVGVVLELINSYGGEDGSNHKQWVLDQIVRVLTGCPNRTKVAGTINFNKNTTYLQWITDYEYCKDDPEDRYSWDKGTAP